MLILQGTLRSATTLGGGTNKKTGEIIPLRNVLQVETLDFLSCLFGSEQQV